MKTVSGLECTPLGSGPRSSQPAGTAPPLRRGWRTPGQFRRAAPDLRSAEDRPCRGRRRRSVPQPSEPELGGDIPTPNPHTLSYWGSRGSSPFPRAPPPSPSHSPTAAWGQRGRAPQVQVGGEASRRVRTHGRGDPVLGLPSPGRVSVALRQEDQGGGPGAQEGAHPGSSVRNLGRGVAQGNPGTRAATRPSRSACPGAGVWTRGPHLPGRPRPSRAGRPHPPPSSPGNFQRPVSARGPEVAAPGGAAPAPDSVSADRCPHGPGTPAGSAQDPGDFPGRSPIPVPPEGRAPRFPPEAK